MAHCQDSAWTFEWKIGNLSYSTLKKGKAIESPMFDAGPSATTKWLLVLYPRGIVDEEHVGIYLRRENDIGEPTIAEVNFQFAFLNNTGSVLNKRSCSKRGFAKGSISGIGEFLKQDELFGSQREKYFPGGILIVQCTVWTKDEMPAITKKISAQTIFEINRRVFFWSIDEFSTLFPGRRNYFVITNESGKVLMRFHLLSNVVREIILEITSWDEILKSFSFEISVIAKDRRKVTFGSPKILTFDSTKKRITLLSTEQLMRNESTYFPNDVLSMACEYIFSTGTVLHICEEINFGIVSPYKGNMILENVKEADVSQNESHQALVNDLKCIYNDAVLCDIEIRTSTKTFPAHKTILSARSSVFSRMFSNDMREKNRGHVDITDLEDDTVHQMLLYIYTDFLEDLQLESASKLYSAADKYAIFSLKEKCSSFLKDNISPNQACDILTLADTHQDDDLKCAVQDYILAHGKDIFGSVEWKDFMGTNLELAADIMHRKLSQM